MNGTSVCLCGGDQNNFSGSSCFQSCGLVSGVTKLAFSVLGWVFLYFEIFKKIKSFGSVNQKRLFLPEWHV